MIVNSKCSFSDRIQSLQFLQHLKLIYFSSIKHAVVYNKHQGAETTRNPHHPNKTQKKRTTFTYIGPEIKFISKLFKNTNINIAYKTNNTIEKLLSHHTKHQYTTTSAKFNKIGIYQLTCPDCNMTTLSTYDKPTDPFSQGIANIFDIINMTAHSFIIKYIYIYILDVVLDGCTIYQLLLNTRLLDEKGFAVQ